MRFFEIHDPYYALIKAGNEEQAIEKYVEVVADDDGTLRENIKEVSRDYALVIFSRATGEDNSFLSVDELLKKFEKDISDVLAIDGALI